MFYGADTAELSAFAHRCDLGSRSVLDLVHRLDALVLSVAWDGPDAEALRADWRARTGPGLVRAATMLLETRTEAITHAEEQDLASAPARDSADAASGPGPGTRLGNSELHGAAPSMSLVSGASAEFIGRMERESRPTGFPGVPGLDRGGEFRGADISSEISGIAPGEPDTGKDVWDWVLGRKDSPLPDLPGGGEHPAPPGGGGEDGPLGDGWGGKEQEVPPTSPTKPANWPDDMPWPPSGPFPGDSDDQYVYGDEGHGSAGDATNDPRPVGTQVDEGGQLGVGAGGPDGGGYAEGKWVVNGGASATSDEHSNFTVTAGGRAGVEAGGAAGTSDGTGVTASGTAEVYAEGGLTVGRDGYGVGWRAGGEASGSASYSEVNEDGSSSIYTVEGSAKAGGHASHHVNVVRNGEGEASGITAGFDVGGGASAGYNYTEEHISPQGWFQMSTTTSDGVGKSVGLSGNAVVSTDEVSFSLGGGIPGIDTGPLSGAAIGINPNRIVEDVSGGAFDADDVVATAKDISPF